MHTNIHANEGVPSDIRLTSAATNDSFMLKPTNYNDGDIIAMDRPYYTISYCKRTAGKDLFKLGNELF